MKLNSQANVHQLPFQPLHEPFSLIQTVLVIFEDFWTFLWKFRDNRVSTNQNLIMLQNTKTFLNADLGFVTQNVDFIDFYWFCRQNIDQ